MRDLKHALFLLLAFTACTAGGDYKTGVSAEHQNAYAAAAESEMPVADFTDSKDIVSPTPTSTPAQDQTISQKLIKQADLSCEVLNYEASRKRLNTIVKKWKGYVANEQLENSDYQIRNTISIRVPMANFDSLLLDLQGLASRIYNKTMNVQDVTEKYYDLESRLATKKATEQTYVRLLDRAHSISDILEIERKLGQIREDIESTEGRFRVLQHQISLSTIDLSLVQKLEYEYVDEKKPGFWERLVKSLDHGWRGFLSFILGMFRIWPFWIIIAAIWYGLRKAWIKRRQQRH